MRYSVLKHTVGKVASLDMRRYARNVPMTQVRLHHKRRCWVRNRERWTGKQFEVRESF